jgi:hypothetical protein
VPMNIRSVPLSGVRLEEKASTHSWRPRIRSVSQRPDVRVRLAPAEWWDASPTPLPDDVIADGTHNRKWQLLPKLHVSSTPERIFSQRRAVALNMASATIHNHRQRNPIPRAVRNLAMCQRQGAARQDQATRHGQHASIASASTTTCSSACVVDLLRQERPGQPNSRKLGSVAEVASRKCNSGGGTKPEASGQGLGVARIRVGLAAFRHPLIEGLPGCRICGEHEFRRGLNPK